MICLNKLLVVTPSHSIQKQAITRAVRLAQAEQAQLTLFSVAEEIPKEQLAWITVVPPQELLNTLVNEQLAELNEFAEQNKDLYPNIDTAALIGTPFIEAIKKVKNDHYDLVVLASRSTERRSKRFFGSTTIRLMRKCPCPVWAVGEHESIKRIVAAVELYAPTEQGLRLNESILQWALWLAKQEQAELHIVYAWQRPGDGLLKSHTSESDHRELATRAQRDRQARLDKLIEGSPSDSPPLTHLIEGRPQEVIPNYVEDHHIDLIVMGTVCRTGIKGFFIGNTAESILGEVGCSVLSLKPEGFISPVD